MVCILLNNDTSYTWERLKELANSLSEDQLKKPVKWWGDGSGGTIDDANVLDEDWVSDGVAYQPKSAIDEDAIDKEAAIFEEGTPMLWMA